VILQAAIYCGVPAAMDSMRIASEVIRQMRTEKAAEAG
jgi:4-carboxymuconolactone decarboxylase